MDYFIDASWRDTEFFAKLILAYFHRLEKLFKQNFTRMNWGYLLCLHFFTSMIINNLNIICQECFEHVKKKGPLCIKEAFLIEMAEREGFEPSVEFSPHTRLAGERLQPARPSLQNAEFDIARILHVLRFRC